MRPVLVKRGVNRVSTGQRTPEQEFKLRLDALDRDARAAALIAYTSRSLHYIASQKPSLVKALDRNAGFWNPVLGAMQTASIVALGRIYDKTKGVLSAERLLEHATTYPGIFSRNALAARKIGRGLTTLQAAEYVATAFAPTTVDFDSLSQELEVHRSLYEATIGPIRNNVAAHSGPITEEEMRDLFANVQMVDFDKLVVFPLVLNNEMWQLFENGNKPNLRPVESNIAVLTANPLGSNQLGLEHRYAIKHTAKFLEWLDSTMESDSFEEHDG